MKPYEPEKFEREYPADGTYAARCVQVVDLGWQETKWGPRPRIQLGFELSEKMKDGKPFMVSYDDIYSWRETGRFYKTLLPWIGAEALSTKPNVKEFLNMEALVTVGTTPSKKGDGKMYTNILSLSKLPKGLKAEPRENDLKFFDFDTSGWKDFESLATQYSAKKSEEEGKWSPSWLQSKVMNAQEWNDWCAENNPDLAKKQSAANDDDIPF